MDCITFETVTIREARSVLDGEPMAAVRKNWTTQRQLLVATKEELLE